MLFHLSLIEALMCIEIHLKISVDELFCVGDV